MGSRLRENPEKLFEVFVEIARPDSQNTDPFVLQKFPETYDDEEVLKSIPKFAFPCIYEGSAVDHFTFVLTDIEGKHKFGFCRHATGAQTCLCIISCLPWYSIFYKYLNMLAEIINRSDTTNLLPMLRGLHREKLPAPGYEIVVISPDFNEKFSAVVPDPEKLPSIPENRNLTEYYNAVDANNMMTIFASMLHERRILITSRKLSRLTACAHAAAELIYPMYWQHLFIPVLPTHLVDYCSAPMPYIIGIHVSIMQKIKRTELGDAVILDADDNKISTPYNDVENIPSDVMSTLKRRLRGHQTERIRSNLMGEGVSKAFLTAICHLIGYYREGLKLREGEKMVFDRDQFIQSRPAHMQPFLEEMVQLQIFEQFVNDRLEKLNSGTWPNDEFEKEVLLVQEKSGPSSEWMYHMKKQTRNLKKVGREGRDRLAELTSKVKDRSKKVAREFKSKIDDSFKKEEEEEEASGKKTNLEHRKTITSAAVKSQRPPRPPPPNRRSGGQRTSYDRTLQYQVLDVDTMVETDSAPRTTDDIKFPRVSLDLMNDPDIRNIYQQSYSMEDLTALDEKEDTDEALISTTSSGSSLTGSADLISIDQSFVAGKPSVSGALDTTAPTPPPRLKKLSANIPHSLSEQSLQSSSSASGSEDPAAVPQIINQSFLVGASDSTATKPSNSQAVRPSPTPRTSLNKPDLLINLGADTNPDDVIFDPLLAGSGAIGDTSYGSNSGASDLQSPKSRQPVMRKPAVRNGANRPSVAQRNSQIIATDAQSIRDARSNFISTGGARPPVLDPFDPLVPVEAQVNQMTPSPAKEQIAVSSAGDEDNLLKEWNLNFEKLKVDPGSPRPFSVPQGTLPNGTRNSGYPMGSPMHRPVSRAAAHQMSSPYAYQPRFQSPLANQHAAGLPATSAMTPQRSPTNQAPSIQVNLTIPSKPINRVGSAPAFISSHQGASKNTSNIDLLSELDPLANKNKQSFGKS